MAADRHLLFGLLALQTGLIQQSQLIAAFHAWICDKSAAPVGSGLRWPAPGQRWLPPPAAAARGHPPPLRPAWPKRR